MKKKLCITLIILVVAVIIFVFVYKVNISQIDTKYAVNFSKVFQTYDINVVDSYFTKDTCIIYNGKQTTYDKVRNNIVIACKEKKYNFSEGSSYGYGNDKFINGVQDVGIRLYGNLCGEKTGECKIKIKLRKTGLFSFEIESVESNDEIFGYIFFGKHL